MKRIIVVLLIVILGYGLALSENKLIPAPFEKAKEIALKAIPNRSGNYFVEFEGNINGEPYYYLIAYIPASGNSKGIIGIGRYGVVFEYTESTQKFTVFIYEYGQSFDADESKVIKEAFKVFRELVTLGLI